MLNLFIISRRLLIVVFVTYDWANGKLTAKCERYARNMFKNKNLMASKLSRRTGTKFSQMILIKKQTKINWYAFFIMSLSRTVFQIQC